MPLYPIAARIARVQGLVKIKVVTDGEKVTSLDVESGPPMLAKSAAENIRTWEFAKHKPTTFVSTFEYEFESPDECTYGNGSSILRLPLDVRIRVKGLKTCDPATESRSHF
jgi:hypothetical protein